MSAAVLSVLPAQAATVTRAHAAAPRSAAIYIVRPGDTLSSIAARFRLPLATLEAENPQITNHDRIYPGQRIRVGGTIAARPLAAITPAAPTGFQACVIARESGGNPRAVNPVSGAGGLYQFLPSTWASLGFPGLPQNASVATQNAAFWKLYAERGTAPWAPYDGC